MTRTRLSVRLGLQSETNDSYPTGQSQPSSLSSSSSYDVGMFRASSSVFTEQLGLWMLHHASEPKIVARLSQGGPFDSAGGG